MKNLLVPAAVALLIGAVVSELHARLFPGRYVPLLAAIVIGIFAGALVTLRVLGSASRSTPKNRTPAPEQTTRGAARKDEAAPTSAPARVPSGEREAGRVKWFNRTKGFGFIVRDRGGEIFVHHRNIEGSGRQSLRDGQRVTFVVGQGDKGPQAERVADEA
jgi:cold shock CspA family protein